MRGNPWRVTGAASWTFLPIVARYGLAVVFIAIGLGLMLLFQLYFSVWGAFSWRFAVYIQYGFAIVLSVACLLCR
jgi:hypothetical protein